MSSSGSGINQLGQVMGVSMNGNASHAFIDADGVMMALPVFPDHSFDAASAINDYGQTVGVAHHSPAGPDVDARGLFTQMGHQRHWSVDGRQRFQHRRFH
jgi:probable HAF family extracellular repeat protein